MKVASFFASPSAPISGGGKHYWAGSWINHTATWGLVLFPPTGTVPPNAANVFTDTVDNRKRASIRVPADGVIRNLRVHVPISNSALRTFTLRRGADVLLEVAAPVNQTGTFTDQGEVAVSAGDEVYMRYDAPENPNLDGIQWEMEYEED